MKNFISKLFVFSLVIAATDFCWIRFMPIEKHIPHVWMMLSFFVLATAGFHFIALKSSKGNAQSFVRTYMGITALKLLLYLAIILIFCLTHKPVAFQFAFGFLAHYFAFAIFEVAMLLRQLKDNK